MFSLRKNSNNDRKNKTKINFENWEDIVKYPEHKNKSKDLIFEEDLENNIQFIDKTEEFKKDVKKFTRDQRWRNKNITQNISRDKKTSEEMEMWLKDKEVASNYTVQENSIFFKKKFNDNRDKIINFYKNSLNGILEASNIDKKRVIFATIHFDQTAPHLHFSLSNLKTKFHKTLNKEIMSVNATDFNPVNQLKIQQNKRQAWFIKNKLTQKEKVLIRSRENMNTFKNKYAKFLNFHSPIIKKINEKYKVPLYKNIEDHISMEKVRGYKRNVSNEQLDTLVWHNIKNQLIFKFRETKLKKELESSKKLITDPKILIVKKLKFHNQYNNLKRKYEMTINNKETSLKPNIPEQNMLNKKKYFLRKDIDLEIIFGKNAFLSKANEIQKNRFYNKLLYLCNEIKMTPQKLAQSLYFGQYVPKKYHDKNLDMIQKTILRTTNLKYNEEIQKDKQLYLSTRKRMENVIEQNIDKLRIFVNVEKNDFLVNEKEKNRTKNIGINSSFVKIIKLNSQIQKNRYFKLIPLKCKVDILCDKNFQKSISDKIEKMNYTKNFSFKKYSKSSNLASLLDSLDYSVQKELDAIKWLQKNSERDIELES